MYKIGTVCMIGELVNGEFVQLKETKYKGVQQGTLDKLVGATGGEDRFEKANKNRIAVLDKIKPLALANVDALYLQIKHIASLPEKLRMFRIGSGLLPMLDHPDYFVAYKEKGFRKELDKKFKRIRKLIKRKNIRVTCHPDKFNVINSDKESVRLKTINTLYAHKYFMERISSVEQGSVINIHVTGKLDSIPEFENNAHKNLIPWLSFENDDVNSKGFLEPTLNMCEKYGVKCLFDLHHYFIETDTWLKPKSDTFKRILKTWGNVRPKFHLSQSRSNEGNVRERAAHSNQITDKRLIKRSAKFLKYGDMAIEAKHKNVAVVNYYSNVVRILK